ncbi:MAG TPA: NADPH-dependent FMN reductase [Legionellaceae bacterium]|nr:NADPH-dependent FMN reductase [Legionellaceae bacterium]
MYQIAVIIGSLRKESLNRKLAQAIQNLSHPLLDFSLLNIADIPLYNQDIEIPLPQAVTALKQSVREADGVLWLTPEYNRSIPGVLKNVIDWGTRPYGESVWAGKGMAVLGTSPGVIGTAVAQSHFRSIMVALGAFLIGQPEIYLVYKEHLINDRYELTDESTRQLLNKFLDQFAAGLKKITQP